MSLVESPLGQANAAPMVRAMLVGQHVIALALTLTGIVRAIGTGTAPWAAIAAGCAVLVTHAIGTLLPGRGTGRRWLLAFTAVWIGAVAVSSAFVWLAFLLWLLAGHLLPLRWGVVYSVCVMAVTAAAPLLHHSTTTYAEVFGPLIGGVFAFGISRGYLQLLRDAQERERFVDALTHAQGEMAALQDELAHAQRQSGALAERTRLAREIHDTVAQGLSSIRLIAHAETDRSEDPRSSDALARIESLAGQSLTDVRRIVAALAPVELERTALATALDRLLSRLREETGMEASLYVDPDLPLLPTSVEVALLRSAQSALANVRQHAAASRVVVSLTYGDGVRLDVVDDGRGFDLPSWEAAGKDTAASFGLRFMRARLKELGGGLDIEASPDDGTALSIHLPLGAS